MYVVSRGFGVFGQAEPSTEPSPEPLLEPSAAPAEEAEPSPVTTEEFPMTGEQFAWHIQHMLWGLDRLSWKIPQMAEEARAGCALLGGAGPVASAAEALCNKPNAELYAAVDTINDAAWRTASILGDDWQVVGVTHRNAAAIAYRLGKMDPTLAQGWYTYVSHVLDYGHDVLAAELDYRLAIAEAELNFWVRLNAMRALPLVVFAKGLEALGAFAAGVVAAAGAAAGAVAGGALAGLWKAVKPLILPTLIVGGAALGGMYLWRQHREKFLGPRKEKPEAKAAAKAGA